MPEFILDTSGTVDPPESLAPGYSPTLMRFEPGPMIWSHLDPFAQGYIEALFFTESSDPAATVEEWEAPAFQHEVSEGRYGGSFPSECGFSDLAPETLERIIRDCQRFQDSAARFLTAAYALEPGSEGLRYARNPIDARRAGQLFWYARNGHGVSFMDDGDADCLSRLQRTADAFGQVWPEFGDDHRIYLP